uniref:Uncharacterized protein MANES_11G013700 n=1 Tax=Rhizophora mucronata TaxID=61149 RepID=A0A2P2KMR1_RHIMU
MCGGAIIADLVPPTATAAGATNARSLRRLTADFLWPDLKKPAGKQYSKPVVVDPVDHDFEADFQEFKDDTDVDEDEDVKPFAFSAAGPLPPRKSGLSRCILCLSPFIFFSNLAYLELNYVGFFLLNKKCLFCFVHFFFHSRFT